MKIRNKNTGAEYSSATLEKHECVNCIPYYSDRNMIFHERNGWEEVKDFRNEIIINGVHHVLIEDKNCSCEVCLFKNQCATEEIYSYFCTYLFQQNKLSHFEIREETK